MANQNTLSAKEAGLRYVTEDELCLRREKMGIGFIYVDEEGKKIKNKELLQHFYSLVIPPAWTDVSICSKKNGHIQATGRDAKGRKQYIYHPKWDEKRNETKFNRMIEFAEALPKVRRHVEKDLRKKKLSLRKVLAVIIRLLEETLIRIGNKVYAEENNSFGLTTLRDKHIKVNGSTLRFQFNGKRGKPLEMDLNDKRLARLVKKCQDIPGYHLFQYYDEDEKRYPVESNDVNLYLNSIVEEDFTAKDFRTWGATVTAVEEFYKIPLAETELENKKNITQVIKNVAKALNNTPAVCRKYYIHPDVIEAYLDGYLFKVMSKKRNNKSKYALDPEEKAALKILKKYKSKNKHKKAS